MICRLIFSPLVTPTPILISIAATLMHGMPAVAWMTRILKILSVFLLNPWGETLFVDICAEDRIVGVAVTDATADGLSAVYTFFDPDFSARGLGRYCILQQIKLCQAMSLPYLYLGYWVDGCRKMQYKTEFCPQEQFDGHQWQRIDKPASALPAPDPLPAATQSTGTGQAKTNRADITSNNRLDSEHRPVSGRKQV